jgi:hypothetical protein
MTSNVTCRNAPHSSSSAPSCSPWVPANGSMQLARLAVRPAAADATRRGLDERDPADGEPARAAAAAMV